MTQRRLPPRTVVPRQSKIGNRVWREPTCATEAIAASREADLLRRCTMHFALCTTYCARRTAHPALCTPPDTPTASSTHCGSALIEDRHWRLEGTNVRFGSGRCVRRSGPPAPVHHALCTTHDARRTTHVATRTLQDSALRTMHRAPRTPQSTPPLLDQLNGRGAAVCWTYS